MAQTADGDERIGVIDTYGTYGVGRLNKDTVLRATGLQVGDAVPTSTSEILQELKALPGVRQAAARIVHVPNQSSGVGITVVVYIGIDDGTLAQPTFRAMSSSDAVLPNDVLTTYRDFEFAMKEAIRRGNFSDDFSRGHSLMGDPAARAVQERFIPLADQHFGVLVEVLESSRIAEQRAIAAWVVAYSTDKKAIAPILAAASRDPDATVRNNAMRALGGYRILRSTASHPRN